MKRSALYVAMLISITCLSATAETVTPLQGQTSQTIQKDISECQAQAGSTSSVMRRIAVTSPQPRHAPWPPVVA